MPSTGELKAQIDELQAVVDMVHDQKASLQTELEAANNEKQKLAEMIQDLKVSLSSVRFY